MSASERLRELDEKLERGPWRTKKGNVFQGDYILASDYDLEGTEETAKGIATLRNVLPLIADVVEAAEEYAPNGVMTSATTPGAKLRLALTALREALDKNKEGPVVAQETN